MTARNQFHNPTADSTSITPVQLEDLIDLQSTILGATVGNDNQGELLERLCLFAEKLALEAVASVMVYDQNKEQLFVEAAPSIPADAIKDLNGLKVGEGSCGNAVFHNEPMYICNTLTDSRWDNVRSFAETYKINACWSSPVRNKEKQPIGSFALSSFETRTPDNFQRRILDICASITSIIFQREESRRELKHRENNLQQSKKNLIASQQQYRSFLDNSADAMFLHKPDGQFIEVNQMACDDLGYTRDELLTMSVLDIEKGLSKFASFSDFTDSLPFDDSVTVEGIHQHKDGSQFPTDVRLRKFISNDETFVVASVRNITEKKKAEEEMLKVRKLESIGLLAGGIAHDFNNMLGSVLGNIDLANRTIDSTDKASTYLKNASNASLRAADLTQQLLTFSKGGEPLKQSANIMDIIRESSDFSMHGSNVQVNYHYPDNLWAAHVDSGQISQVIQNLVINARQAMPDGGQLDIYCENFILKQSSNVMPMRQGHYIKIKVVDTGIGIPDTIVHSIFDPYFSTKQEGSGLGLALSYSIVSKHNGYITATSIQGEGTSFSIYLPVSDGHTEPAEAIAATVNKGPNQARILIMDDDEMIRSLCGDMLGNLGYDVVLAEDGESAISLYRQAIATKNNIDLVIMDLTVPNGMGGKDAIKIFKKLDPNVKTIVSSGYSNDPVMASFKDYGFTNAVSKPYTQDELSSAVSAVLN